MSSVALVSFLVSSINTRTLSAYLKMNGVDVICIFCPVKLNGRNTAQLIKLLKESNVFLVGISAVTDDYFSAVTLTKEIKEKMAVSVIWGGAHANVRPEECLRNADMVCLGEGEEALLELARSLVNGKVNEKNINNIWFNDKGLIIRNEMRRLEEDLDRYPFPDFDLATQYVMNESGVDALNETHLSGEYSIITSRGCPYSCSYCYNSYRRKDYSGKGKFLRARSIGNVIEELSQVKKLFPSIKKINFWDDSFVARSTKDFEKFEIMYVDSINLPFFALVEPMAFDYEKINILLGCGLKSLQVGIQSGSERINKNVYNRSVHNDKIIEISQFINKAHVEVIYDFIFNNPYETREDILETIDLLLRLPKPFVLQGYNLIFYPGTGITEKALQDGHISFKSDKDDFSTIQSRNNCPISMIGKGKISSRFYEINYSIDKNEYLNSIIALISCSHFPICITRFFAKRENRLNLVAVKSIIRTYNYLAKLKARVSFLKNFKLDYFLLFHSDANRQSN